MDQGTPPGSNPGADDLYAGDISNVSLRRLCGGGITNTMESCVAAGVHPNDPNAIIIGDSKLGAASPLLVFNRDELDNFFAAYQAGEI
ncbi:DUF397 domain-containing protein [Micromonospora craniellae]|uniref:DUF397 domain-containing protein n=1 Tax=Micromonospora craniellae TaxID=2294034 RepID=A0A372FR39_9ACTN|nr:DUF397 domain-containing protein [Micromonospora craniellae]QOC93993.1 DUF397 domain-containing protein [Micromonospora craniellae]RFS40489.1 DUF397 domain-containing protein [Micromonospora craniellae]